MTFWQIPAKGAVVAHRPDSREGWLKLRERAVTASDAGALLGIHEYTTLYELWARKRGLLSYAMADDPVLTRGELLEDDAIELVRRRHPTWKISHNVIPGGIYLEDTESHLGATPDAFVITDDATPAILQVKTTDMATFRQKWLQADVVEPPLWIAVQAMLEAYLAGAQQAFVAVLTVGRTLDLSIVSVPISLPVIQKLQKAAAAFWRAVESDNPPDPDYARDGAAIAALMPQDHGTSIDLSHDNEFCDAVAERQRLKAEADAISTALGRCDALIKHRIGTHAVATIPGFTVSHRTQRRKAFAVAACEFRKLIIKEAP